MATPPVSKETPCHSTTQPTHSCDPTHSAGLGDQPSTLSSAGETEEVSGVWNQMMGYCETFGDFIRNLIIQTLKGLGTAINWIAGKPKNTTRAATHTQRQPHIEKDSTKSTPGITNSSNLSISEKDQHKIECLVSTLGKGWITIIRNKRTIENIGDEIQHVHPLEFLEYVFLDPDLPKDLEKASSSSLIWNPFIEGITEKMRREAATLAPRKASFAHSLNVNLDDLELFFMLADWKGMIRFLLDVKFGRKTSIWVEPAKTEDPSLSPISQTSPNTPVPISSPANSLADMPFEHTKTLEIILIAYKERFSLSRGKLWSQLSSTHPLKLLITLHSTPSLKTHLHYIFTHLLQRKQFLSALATQLSRHPTEKSMPHLEEFARLCQLDLDRVTKQVQKSKWKELIEDLYKAQTERKNKIA